MEDKQPLLISYTDIYHQRGTFFDNFSKQIFFRSKKIGALFTNYWSNSDVAFNIENFDEMIYTHSHATEYSADIPYNEYYKKSAFMK